MGHTEHPKATQRSGIGPQRALEANSKNPSRTARKPILPRASSASAGPIPRSPKKSQRSGIGPEQALEAIKPIPSRTARKPVLPRASLRAKVRSRGAPKNRSGAGSDRSKHWKRSSPSPRAQRESRSFPELPCERRFGPAEPHHHDTPVNDSYFSSWATITPHRGTGSQSTQRQRDRAGASIGTSTP